MSWLIYFIKVMVIQLAAYLGYRLLLDNERAGQFKRFYLLGSMLLAYVVPFVVVSHIHVVGTEGEMALLSAGPLTNIATGVIWAGSPNISWLPGYFEVSISNILIGIILLIYLAGVLYHLSKFFKFLLLIKKRITGSVNEKSHGLMLVPLVEDCSPHSFFHWCFYSKNRPPNSIILTHEAAHARQLHSLDRLITTLLKAICWFNPVQLLFERAIIVNHELLADQAVLRSGCDPITYQTVLLTTLRATSVASPLVSGAGFHLTKKRFQMMNSASGSHRTSVFKFLAALSLWGILLFSFGQVGYAQNAPVPPPPPPGPPIPPPPPPVMDGDGVAMKVLVPTASNLAAWQDAETYGVWIDGERVENSVLANYSADDFGHYFKSKLTPTAINYGKHVYQLELMTTAAFVKYNARMLENGTPIPPPPPPVPAAPEY